MELAFTSADDDDATELAGTVTLSQQGPCDLDVNVGIALVDEHGEMLVDEKGEIVAIAGGEIQYVLTADQPTLTVLTRWTNWCGSEEVAATFDAGAFGQELHDPVTPGCQDDSDSTELSPLEFMHH